MSISFDEKTKNSYDKLIEDSELVFSKLGEKMNKKIDLKDVEMQKEIWPLFNKSRILIQDLEENFENKKRVSYLLSN